LRWVWNIIPPPPLASTWLTLGG